MAMELQIISPKPGQKFPTIKWNNEELKVEIAEAMKDYQNLVVTPETEKDNKELRARLNKLYKAIEDARKDLKARANEPVKLFEAQVKEVEEPIKTAIGNLDTQLTELKEMRKEQKKQEIKKAFADGKFPEWLTLDRIWNERWLNATYDFSQIIKDMEETNRSIETNLETINALPEFSFEAEQIYKKTLDFGQAIRQAKEMAEIQRRKMEQEARKAMPVNPQNGEQKQEQTAEAQNIPVEPSKMPAEEPEQKKAKEYTFRFAVTVTMAQAKALNSFCKEQGITLKQI